MSVALAEFLHLFSLNGSPDGIDPQATITGALLGVALFFIFVLAVTLWQIFTRREETPPTVLIIPTERGSEVQLFQRER